MEPCFHNSFFLNDWTLYLWENEHTQLLAQKVISKVAGLLLWASEKTVLSLIVSFPWQKKLSNLNAHRDLSHWECFVFETHFSKSFWHNLVISNPNLGWKFWSEKKSCQNGSKLKDYGDCFFSFEAFSILAFSGLEWCNCTWFRLLHTI